MESPAHEIARHLGERAEAVCRRYLSSGRREGHYWLVGDVHNTPGRSLYVRLVRDADGRPPGKWTDAATGDHGDLLDIIAARCGYRDLRDTLTEARRFLNLPPPAATGPNPRAPKRKPGSPDAAHRLWAASKPAPGTPAADYLSNRALPQAAESTLALRFHPHCYYRPARDDAPETRRAWPAMIAAVTDDDESLMGVHRTWLDPAACDKAPVVHPRSAMGQLLGHGVRFGASGDVMVFGEGIETMLSFREIATDLPLVAGLSAAHLAALSFPRSLRRLYIVRDNDASGLGAFETVAGRADAVGIEVHPIDPRLDDFNTDLQAFGTRGLAAAVAAQIHADDAARFLKR